MGIRTIDRQFYKEFGSQLVNIMEQKKITQNALARKLGCSRQCVSHYLLGIRKIKPEMFHRICDVLEIPTTFEVKVRIGL